MDKLESLESIFSGRLFRVPDYQRGYAWGPQQWIDLLDDLELLSATKTHFAGTLLICRSKGVGRRVDDEGSGYDTFDVIDGQQRLTTLVMFLDAIRDEMDAIPGLRRYGEGIRKRYLTVYDRANQPIPRLRLGADNHEFFFRCVLGFGNDAGKPLSGAELKSQERLQDAHRRFAEYLASHRASQGEHYTVWLEELYDKITARLELLVYEVGSEQDAGVIFEAMNNRGKPITEMDKVKNHLLYLAAKLDLPDPHDLGERVNATWSSIFRHLMLGGLIEGEDEDRLLRVHWLMAYDYQLDQWDQSRTIKNRFNLRAYEGRHVALLTDLGQYVNTLGLAAQALSEIYNPEQDRAFSTFAREPRTQLQIVAMSERLRRLGQIAPFLPLLIAVRLRCDDAETYLRAVTLAELFAFRVYAWLGKRSSIGLSRLTRLGHDLFTGRQTVDVVLDNLQRAAVEFCLDAWFAAAFERPGNWYEWNAIKYLLYEYEQHLAEQQRIDVRLTWAQVDRRKKQETIEHILPQHPDADGYWSERFTPEQREIWTHDLGNLCLTQHNSELGNRPFPQKVGVLGDPSGKGYINSIVLMEKALASYSDWDEAAIIERRNQLRTWTLERWRVPELPPPPEQADRELMIRMLTRIPVPTALRQVLAALYRAGIDGQSGSQLAELLSYRLDQLAGVLGGLGRRINQTAKRQDGRVVDSALVLTFESRNGEWIYRLRPEFREVLESPEVANLGIVQPKE